MTKDVPNKLRTVRPGPLVLVALSLALSVIPADLLLRLQPAWRPVPDWYPGEQQSRASPYYQEDSVIGWRLIAGHSYRFERGGRWSTVRANGQGMRSDFDFASGCGTPHVALVGDSYLFGTGVDIEQTAAAILARSLGPHHAIYNFALPGHGVDQMLLVGRSEALVRCPALMIVGFIDDDFQRSLTAFRNREGLAKPMFLLEDDTLRLATTADRPGLFGRAWRNSAIGRFVDLKLRDRARYRPSGRWWRLNTALLEAMARDAERAQVPVLFVRIPVKGAPVAFPALQDFMTRRGLSYLDLARPELARPEYFLRGDMHFNPEGQAWLAGELLRWLRSSGLESLQALAH